MRSAIRLLALCILATFSSAALACLSIAPAASEWVACAEKLLPAKAERKATSLFEVRNGRNANRRDKRGEAHWLAIWRVPLARSCGSIADVRRKDAQYQTGFLPEEGLDEIDMIAWGNALRN